MMLVTFRETVPCLMARLASNSGGECRPADNERGNTVAPRWILRVARAK
jgi:hypothetical protein